MTYFTGGRSVNKTNPEMNEMTELADQDFKTAIINPLNLLSDLKDSMDTILGEKEDI